MRWTDLESCLTVVLDISRPDVSVMTEEARPDVSVMTEEAVFTAPNVTSVAVDDWAPGDVDSIPNM